jgi:RimJ/RimL family protein N-acetyltransferase
MIAPLTDKKEIEAMVNSPELYGRITDDLSPDYFICDDALYLSNIERTGLMKFEPLNGMTTQVHVMAFQKLLGKTGAFVREGLEWVFNHTTYMKIITFVPAYNLPALKLAQRSGLKEEGIVTKSFLKNWVLHDQYIYGITKEEFRRIRLCH